MDMKNGMTVGQAAALCGLSVRTLRYYDQIGLLRPETTTPAGYRLYGEAQLERLQQILFFRELDVPLAKIGKLLDDPSFDRARALARHRRLLSLKRDRLERLIGLVDRTLAEDPWKGASKMSIREFNQSEIQKAAEEYAQEARELWGATPAYAESRKRTGGYKQEDWDRIQTGMDRIFGGLADLMARGADPAGPEALALAREWQDFLTENFYSCSPEMLAGLGRMYVEDQRFTQSLDSRYGEGAALFASEAFTRYAGQN